MPKKYLLPVVHPDIANSIKAEIEVTEDGSLYFGDIFHRIQKENPQIAIFIGFFSSTSKDPESALCSALMVYRMLESQAEVDRMEGKGEDRV